MRNYTDVCVASTSRITSTSPPTALGGLVYSSGLSIRQQSCQKLHKILRTIKSITLSALSDIVTHNMSTSPPPSFNNLCNQSRSQTLLPWITLSSSQNTVLHDQQHPSDKCQSVLSSFHSKINTTSILPLSPVLRTQFPASQMSQVTLRSPAHWSTLRNRWVPIPFKLTKDCLSSDSVPPNPQTGSHHSHSQKKTKKTWS